MIRERFDIRGNGESLKGELHNVSYRASGRRIVVRDGLGAVVHDTGECYDLDNATHNLDCWLEKRLGLTPTFTDQPTTAKGN